MICIFFTLMLCTYLLSVRGLPGRHIYPIGAGINSCQMWYQCQIPVLLCCIQNVLPRKLGGFGTNAPPSWLHTEKTIPSLSLLQFHTKPGGNGQAPFAMLITTAHCVTFTNRPRLSPYYVYCRFCFTKPANDRTGVNIT